MSRLECLTLSSLEKVFWDQPPAGPAFTEASLLQGERFSYQIAYRQDAGRFSRQTLRVSVSSPIAAAVTVRRVEHVPCAFPCYDPTENYLRTSPGFYPDVLKPLDGPETWFVAGRWESLWVEIRAEDLPAGEYPITVTLSDGEDTAVSRFTARVLPLRLPPQTFLFTQWLHGDGIAHAHHAAMFSEKFWAILANYLQTARRCGINLILTPLFTPPLDTAPGGERLTCQLVDVTVSGGEYAFGFDRLARWIALCRDKGITRFELSHLFTQWGARYAPKVVAAVDGVEKRLFGWETPGNSPEYKRFLAAFLPALSAFLDKQGVAKEDCYLHISDEPHAEHWETYREASEWVARLMPGYPVMDAMSDYPIYQKSTVDNPVVAIDAISDFLQNKVPNLWGYYCCSQEQQVSNRFMAMPSARNRILGMQAYKFGLKGFLHWGYNFYNSQFSLEVIDPYAVTDARCAFPSGDAFSVYPCGDGCAESLRAVVFHDGLQDLRALEMLESLAGRDAALRTLEEGLSRPLSFTDYPHDAAWLWDARQRIHQALLEQA